MLGSCSLVSNFSFVKVILKYRLHLIFLKKLETVNLIRNPGKEKRYVRLPNTEHSPLKL